MIRTELDESLEELAADVKRRVSSSDGPELKSGDPKQGMSTLTPEVKKMRKLRDMSVPRPVLVGTHKSTRLERKKGAHVSTYQLASVEDRRPMHWWTRRARKGRLKDSPRSQPTGEKPVLFSERHPTAFKASRLLLPRVPVLLVALPLVYFMLANLLKRDYFFILRWYRESWILPHLVSIISSKAAFMHWWKFYGPITIMVILFTCFSLIVFYLFVWRFFFKNYTRQSEGVETAEGRAYWVEGRNMWFTLWDGLYGPVYQRRHKAPYRPDRRTVTVYLNTSFFPPPSPSAPARKMLKVRLSRDRDEWIENRGAYELIGHEGLYRRITGIREMETHNVGYKSDPIAMREAKRIFKDRMDGLVKDTQKLSKANVSVRLDQMKSGTVQMDDELREMINEQRKKKTAT